LKRQKTKKRTVEKAQKNSLKKEAVSDVTRDFVIITRDLPVIRNHTNHKSQGHKVEMKQQLEE